MATNGGARAAGELTSYVGRRREGAEVRSLLGMSRLVTLTGPGGVGKTRLAARVGRDAGRTFADGAVFVGLAELRDPDALANLVADRLELHDASGRAGADAVFEHLRGRRSLVVLDNCEHVVDAAAEFVRALLTECRQVTVLATSRQSLGVAGERVLPVPPLAVPDDPDRPVRELINYDGVALFVERASAVWPLFRLTADNQSDVVRLCRQVDGLPLAIELAATRIRTLSPAQIADRLTEGLALLTTGARTAPPRQRTLRATIDWSFELCTAPEREVWARASVFAGSFDLEAAEAVCGGDSVLDLVDSLVDKSVLVRDDDSAAVRFRMLEPLREYGQEQLAGQVAEVARAHRDWFDRLTERADADWVSPRQVAWIDRLRRDQANLRAALDWSLGTPGEAGVALRMAMRVNEYWALRGLTVEARTWLDRALAAVPADHPDRAVALCLTALFALLHSDLDLANARLDEAARLDDASPHVSHVRSLALVMAAQPGSAKLAGDAAAAFRDRGDVRHELHPLFLHAVGSAYRGEFDTSRAAIHRMITLTEQAGDAHYRAMAHFGHAVVELHGGNVDIAEEAARTALRVDIEAGIRLDRAYHTDALAWVSSRRGDHQRAARLFGIAAAQWDALGVSPDVAVSLAHRVYQQATREALGERRFDAAFAGGRAMSPDEALGYALGTDTAPPDQPLTPRELEIARLVSDGMTNREIAGRLVIALRTADTHVQNILTKLDFANRAQIAAWVAKR
ncbi:ATP-binding protein [Actinokineospora sp. HUAS TT18]|uniref:ATP-binding protein n=1 Tax=Actinokineospora sp. HUAS TT18 TaxID=3447451 RepID=UPI003F5272DA